MRGLHVCSIWCEAECQHHVPCEIMSRPEHLHPEHRGKPRHYGYDGKLQHEWTGHAGRCTTSPLPEED